jgi:hypothetical protein
LLELLEDQEVWELKDEWEHQELKVTVEVMVHQEQRDPPDQ